MEKIYQLPEGETAHAMVVLNDHVFIHADGGIYSFYVPPKTIWMRIKDLVVNGKSWLVN